MYITQQEKFLSSLEASHGQFYKAAVFGGPSLYFHKRALADGQVGLPAFAESSYAMLASWGMHRMGRGGAKMADFGGYEDSLRETWPTIKRLQGREPSAMTATDWDDLKATFLGIKAMQSAFSLVATSKVLAHALPTLVPPVDRQYTIKFLYGSRVLPKNIDGEWDLLKNFLEFFFYPVLREERFQRAFAQWQANCDRYPWDTSPLKTIDNLLVGHMRINT